jgi:membrane protease YdiL (CAAX protease family)
MSVGAVAILVAWRLVAARRASPWNLIVPVTGLLGAGAVATGHVALSPSADPYAAAVAGLGAGLLLYAATVGFVMGVRRWPVFYRHVGAIYAQREGVPLPWAVALAAGVTAPGEELFWRGLFQSVLAAHLGWWGAAGATLACYVGVASGSGSLPLLAGGIVGGAVWGGLAVWTHGVLAGLACHAIWTALMLIAPPGGGTRTTEGRPRGGESRAAL